MLVKHKVLAPSSHGVACGSIIHRHTGPLHPGAVAGHWHSGRTCNQWSDIAGESPFPAQGCTVTCAVHRGNDMVRISKAGTALIIVNLDRLLWLTLSDDGLLCLRRLDHQRRHIGCLFFIVAAGVQQHAG